MTGRFAYLLLFLFIGVFANATHNRAGEITYKWKYGFTYEIILITYTDDGPQVADRCRDTIFFGDGTYAVVDRVNGPQGTSSDCGNAKLGEVLFPKFKKNVYITTHTYNGYGTYKIYMFDRNRNEGVKNIPGSVNQPFYVETLLKINQFGGPNNSPAFTVLPYDQACIGRCFYHNPGAYDIDGDSLSYELTTCKGEDFSGNIGVTIPGYTYPNVVGGGSFTIHPTNGTLSWCSPQFMQGEYNAAFIIKEWRKNFDGKYEMVGYVMRDMQIKVGTCINNPPIIAPISDTCVVAGTLINKTFTATDADTVSSKNFITLSAFGAPFSVNPPVALFSSSPSSGTVTGNFSWQTVCGHIRKSPYQVTVKAADNDPQIQLVDFKTYNITVVAPPPKNLTASPIGTSVKLVWNKTNCNNTTGSKISYYSVYRKKDCTPWQPGPCETGVPDYTGFSNIGHTTGPEDTTYTDTNGGIGLSHGVNYSYLVVAVYNDGPQVEGFYSYSSNQVCVQLKRDVPIIINVDVLSTGTTNGSNFVRWVKPLLTSGNLDTVALPGPYEFRLSYKQGVSGNYIQVYTVNKPFFAAINQLNDTTFTHLNLNTESAILVYKLDFYANGQFVGSSQTASSVFLSLTPDDRKIKLNWAHYVPWDNYKYYILKKLPGQSTFSLVDSTVNLFYTDSNNLVNKATYCYKVLAKGQYSDPGIHRPLLNNSQEACAKPIDLVPPCSPQLSIISNCETGFIQLKWNNPNNSCADDVIKYNLYFKATEEEPLTLLYTINAATDTVFTFDNLNSIAGCYAVTAIDSSLNESPIPEAVCVDNCPEFELPNVFTSNGDNVNDFFKAIRVKHIKEIDLKIYNRWGQLVYETTDPYFNWDSKVKQTNTDSSDGTYFYICRVNEIRVKGINTRELKGFVQIFH